MSENKNVKNLRKQLMAAIAMVMVAAVALGSSTYAWFANNNNVKATGMKMTASAEGVMLVIDTTQDGLTANKQTTVDLTGIAATDLLPTHPSQTAQGATVVGQTIGAWNHRFSDKFDTAITTSAAAETTIDSVDYSNYFLSQDIWVGLANTANDEATGAVTLKSVAITGGTENFLPCARVAVCDASGKVLGVFAPDGKMVTGYKTQTDADTVGDYVAPTIATALNSTTSSAKVTAYIYFDGRDAACTSEKFNANKISINFEFEAADAT